MTADLRLAARETLALVLRARQLGLLHTRGTRLLLESGGAFPASSGADRSRRLYRHVLRLAHVEVPRDLDTAELARRSWQVVHAARTRLLRGFLRGGAVFCVVLLAVSLVTLLLSAASPALRQRLFPPDLGKIARFEASSVWGNHPLRGVGTQARGEIFFHTNQENNPHLDLDFGRPIRVRKVVIRNRMDCCSERALPLNVEALRPAGERLLCQRRAPFGVWTCRAGGVVTQKLRIEVAGASMLHLHSIEVYE